VFRQAQSGLSLDLQRYTVRMLYSNCFKHYLKSSDMSPKLREMAYSLDLASSVFFFRRGNQEMYDITSTYGAELHRAYEIQRSDELFFRDQLQKMRSYIGEALQY
jgi:hypothetical protein